MHTMNVVYRDSCISSYMIIVVKMVHMMSVLYIYYAVDTLVYEALHVLISPCTYMYGIVLR